MIWIIFGEVVELTTCTEKMATIRFCGELGTDWIYGGDNNDWIFGDTYLMGGWDVDASGDFLFGESWRKTTYFGGNGRNFFMVVITMTGSLVKRGVTCFTAMDGNDLLIGGSGRDYLTGDESGSVWRDTFVFKSTSDFVGTAALHTCDVIADFLTGVDQIDLHAIDASTILDGNNTFLWRGTGAFNNCAGRRNTLSNSHSTLLLTSDYTVVYVDTDGDTTAEFQIEVHGTFSAATSMEYWDFNF